MDQAERIGVLLERLERAVEEAERRVRFAGRRLMTTREAVEVGLLPSERTAARWREEGVGPPYRVVGALVRYDMAEVQAWWDRHKVLTADALPWEQRTGRRRQEARR